LTDDAKYEILKEKSRKNYTKKVVRIEERDNRGKDKLRKDLLKDGYLILESSYTQAANPCSMRDFGPTRNVIYNFSPEK
jgi:hypothetical protein